MVCSYEKNRLRNTLAGALELPTEVSHLFDQFFGGKPQQPRTWQAPASLYEDGDHYTVEIDMPGARQDDLELTLEKGVLSISAERKAAEVEGRKVWHEERSFGRVTRQVTLPETADPESITARFRDGVLSVTVAKKPEAQPKRIEIKSV